jgi:hypothetical protein
MGHRTACAGFLSALADLGPPSTALVGVGTAGRREASASERADVWTRTYVGDGARRIFPADRGGLTHLDREPWPPVGRLVEYVPRVGQHVDDHCLRLPRSGLLRLVSRDRGRRCPGIPVGSTASHARRCRIGGAQGRLPVRAQPSSRFRARGCTCAGSSAGIRTGARRARVRDACGSVAQRSVVAHLGSTPWVARPAPHAFVRPATIRAGPLSDRPLVGPARAAKPDERCRRPCVLGREEPRGRMGSTVAGRAGEAGRLRHLGSGSGRNRVGHGHQCAHRARREVVSGRRRRRCARPRWTSARGQCTSDSPAHLDAHADRRPGTEPDYVPVDPARTSRT